MDLPETHETSWVGCMSAWRAYRFDFPFCSQSFKTSRLLNYQDTVVLTCNYKQNAVIDFAILIAEISQSANVQV